MNARLPTLLGRYAVDAIVIAVGIWAFVEDIVTPRSTIDSSTVYDRGPELVILPTLVAAVALVLLRRRLGMVAPLAAFLLFGISSFPARAWVPSSAPAFIVVLLVSAILGYDSTRRWAWTTLLLSLAVGAIAVSRQPDRSFGTLVFVLVVLGLTWVAGYLVRRPIEQARVAEARARQLETERAVAAEEAIAEERQRIARELHDVIAHSVSVMTVQAGAVRRLLLPEQEKEREALLSVEATGRQALTEMRRLVGLLKEDSVMPMYAPQPGMKTLDVLVGTVREAGLPVDLSVEGEQHELAPGVDLAAYRVVQEALTNALKYAGPARAWVKVQWGGDKLLLRVENDGATDANGQSGGHGLVGMKERVAVVGGTLESGPRPGGGFVVQASIPIGGPA